MTGPGVDDVKIALQKFGWPDYTVFVIMLISCSLIGIYFGFIEKKSKKPSEAAADYLVGGRNMKVFPITMSLIARYTIFYLLYLVFLLSTHCYCADLHAYKSHIRMCVNGNCAHNFNGTYLLLYICIYHKI